MGNYKKSRFYFAPRNR